MRPATDLISAILLASLAAGPLLAEPSKSQEHHMKADIGDDPLNGIRDGPAGGAPSLSDSLRSIPEHLQGVINEEFGQFLRQGLVRPHHLGIRDGETPYQSFVRLFEEKSPGVGDEAPDVPLFDPETNRMMRIRSLPGDLPLLIVFGSYSCPLFRGRLDDLETLADSHRGQLEIVIVYTLEAHPTDENPYVRGVWLSRVNDTLNVRIRQHRNMEERLAVVRNPPQGLDTSIRILVDPVDYLETVDAISEIGSSNPENNPAWKAYGLLPNSAFLVAANGRIAFRMPWFSVEPTLLANIWQLQNKTRYPDADVCYLHPSDKHGASSASCTP